MLFVPLYKLYRPAWTETGTHKQQLKPMLNLPDGVQYTPPKIQSTKQQHGTRNGDEASMTAVYKNLRHDRIRSVKRSHTTEHTHPHTQTHTHTERTARMYRVLVLLLVSNVTPFQDLANFSRSLRRSLGGSRERGGNRNPTDF